METQTLETGHELINQGLHRTLQVDSWCTHQRQPKSDGWRNL